MPGLASRHITYSVPPRPGQHAAEVFRALSILLELDASPLTSHAIALVDVDGLKEINAKYGWSVGNSILEFLSAALQDAIKPAERAAHWAGDQYVVLLPGAGRRAAFWRTRRLLACALRCAPQSYPRVSVSAGIAAYPVDGDTNLALVESATVALRRAKRAGCGRVRTTTPWRVA